MRSLDRRMMGAAMGATLGAAACLAPASAQAVADLVVVREASSVVFQSCDRGQPLATGQIAIKNVGDSRAKLRLGVLTRYTRSLLAVYVPEHLDIIDNARELSALDAQDQESIRFSLGANKVKRGRLGGALRASELEQPEAVVSRPSANVNVALETALDNALLDLEGLNPEEIVDLQRALRQAGFYRGRLDGVIGSGGRAAIRAFQSELGAPETGQLTLAQTEELSRRTNVSLVLVTSDTLPGPATSFAAASVVETAPTPAPARPARPARRDARRTEVTVYAVVDPYNLVQESDETNNLVAFTGVINCE
ncbi:MAG: peptidoglycan-binding protein [Pseudomonadota bacterium]